MTKTPTPASHAVKTALISADLRGMDDAGAQPEALRSALGPLITAFGEAQWQNGRGVPHPDLDTAFEAIITAAQAYTAAQPSRECLKQSAEPEFLAEVSKEQYARMFGAACEALGQISDHLGIDSNLDPGAEPIIEAIDELRAAALQAAPPVPEGMAVPAHDCCNSWFTSLSEGRQSVLRDDKWMLAHAAFDAGRAALAAAPAQEHATQLAGQGQDYSIDADPEGIRARVAGAITGALAFGAQGGNTPPPEHWLTPFWMAARFEAAQINALRELMNGQLEQVQAPFQQRVQPWLLECFGAEIAGDKQERNHRFLEEAVELVQANGCTASEAHQLVDYVFGRPVGEPAQEVGGVMVTLAALCLASGLEMHQAGEVELQRIWGKVEQIRAKQAAKPKHSPLPAAPVQAQEDARDAEIQRAVAAERERICAAIQAEDDHCSTGDYMLDSDDCIKVARGEWVRPVYDAARAAQGDRNV